MGFGCPLGRVYTLDDFDVHSTTALAKCTTIHVPSNYSGSRIPVRWYVLHTKEARFLKVIPFPSVSCHRRWFIAGFDPIETILENQSSTDPQKGRTFGLHCWFNGGPSCHSWDRCLCAAQRSIHAWGSNGWVSGYACWGMPNSLRPAFVYWYSQLICCIFSCNALVLVTSAFRVWYRHNPEVQSQLSRLSTSPTWEISTRSFASFDTSNSPPQTDGTTPGLRHLQTGSSALTRLSEHFSEYTSEHSNLPNQSSYGSQVAEVSVMRKREVFSWFLTCKLFVVTL